MQDMVDHLKRTLGITVSRDYVHRLLEAPRKQTTASKRFKGLVNARVPPKRNTKEKITHVDFHYTCAQVNIVNEMAHLCSSSTLAMSVDNKNKVDVGIPAIKELSPVKKNPFRTNEDFLTVNHQNIQTCSSISLGEEKSNGIICLYHVFTDVRAKF